MKKLKSKRELLFLEVSKDLDSKKIMNFFRIRQDPEEVPGARSPWAIHILHVLPDIPRSFFPYVANVRLAIFVCGFLLHGFGSLPERGFPPHQGAVDQPPPLSLIHISEPTRRS